MRVTYLSQACTLIEVAGKTILSDPWLTEGAYCGSWFHTHLLEESGVSPASLPKKIDCLFLSHEHEDHFDPATLKHLPADVPILICKFNTPRFRRYVEAHGFTNIQELPSGETLDLGSSVGVTVYGTAEYTNDSAIVVEGDGCRLFNETDCKLSYDDYERIGRSGIDIGFYMFSGANWYPMSYDNAPDVMRELVRKRRRSLLKSWVQRVKITRPRVAVPAAGPCTVLDPELLWFNSEELGCCIDPAEAIRVLDEARLPTRGLYMAAGDVWDSRTGYEPHAPARLRTRPRQEYIGDASARLAPEIRAKQAAEPPAGSDLAERVFGYFNTAVAAQTPLMRRRIGTKLGLVVGGRHGSCWTVDFTSTQPPYVRDGLAPDWTYKIEVEDKLLYPFLTGDMPWFEELLITFRVRLARRPDMYSEPLYHFLYDPDPARLENWYAAH
jgi:UDP-MurNAc hydroxylase